MNVSHQSDKKRWSCWKLISGDLRYCFSWSWCWSPAGLRPAWLHPCSILPGTDFFGLRQGNPCKCSDCLWFGGRTLDLRACWIERSRLRGPIGCWICASTDRLQDPPAPAPFCLIRTLHYFPTDNSCVTVISGCGRRPRPTQTHHTLVKGFT